MKRRFLAPEVVQTSAMDCGPAALKCLLDGFHRPVSYGRLREACRTGLDGSCIDTVELVANQLGIPCEQVLLPADHVLVPQVTAIPAVAVVQLPTGMTHFVVIWRRHGRFVQIMDPSVGRRWVSSAELLDCLYRHRMSVPADGWREFAGSAQFQSALKARMRKLGIAKHEAERLCADANSDPEWRPIAALDAATRLVASLKRAKAVGSSSIAAKLLKEFLAHPDVIPAENWSVRSAPPDEDGTPQLLFTGVVLVRALSAPATQSDEETSENKLPQELTAAVAEEQLEPGKTVLEDLFRCGRWSVSMLLIGTLISSAAVLVEALLFRQFFDLAAQLRLPGQRIGAVTLTLVFLTCLLVFDLALFAGGARLGRQIENRLRMRFLNKLPLLPDAYFQSRLISDMAERSHALHRIRNLPDQMRQFLVAALKLLAITAGLIWLEPSQWGLVLLVAFVALLPPFLTKSLLSESDLRVRSHAAGLTRFYLDAMLGLLPIHAHNAQRAVAAEQEKLLGCWAQAALRMQKLVTTIEAAQLAAMYGLVALLLVNRPQQASAGQVLLFLYWTMSLLVLGEAIASVSRRYAYYRNLTLRLLEPLGAPEERPGETVAAMDSVSRAASGAPAISFRGVSVQASGHSILHDIELQIAPSEHVVIVGASGAGKSTLVGLLLGWHKPAAGEILIDGRPLDALELRTRTAWIDPSVQLWNRSLLSNIRYGSPDSRDGIGTVIDAAMLRTVLESLPEGLQTSLGEGGALVSGGEGQRVRVARAMLRKNPRLIILDEPFRGLDREKRRQLIRRVRTLWSNCTLICITHDIAEAEQFDQVVVVEQGAIAEQGSPEELRGNESSRYSQLLAAEADARSALWSGRLWRRLRVQNGQIVKTVENKAGLGSEPIRTPVGAINETAEVA